MDVEFWNLTQNLFLGLIRELDEKNSDSESLSAFIKNINRFALNFFDDRTFSSQMNPKDYKECSEQEKIYWRVFMPNQNLLLRRRNELYSRNRVCQ